MIEYQRFLGAECRARTRDESHPAFVVDSIGLTRMLDLIGAHGLDAVSASSRRCCHTGDDKSAVQHRVEPGVAAHATARRGSTPCFGDGCEFNHEDQGCHVPLSR